LGSRHAVLTAAAAGLSPSDSIEGGRLLLGDVAEPFPKFLTAQARPGWLNQFHALAAARLAGANLWLAAHSTTKLTSCRRWRFAIRNELAPVQEDMVQMRSAISSGNADVVPVGGSYDAYHLSAWRPSNAIPTFSLPFRLARAIRVIPVNAQSQTAAATQFDNVVRNIEQCVASEAVAGTIMRHWAACGDAESVRPVISAISARIRTPERVPTWSLPLTHHNRKANPERTNEPPRTRYETALS
jgi:hypothetical protein